MYIMNLLMYLLMYILYILLLFYIIYLFINMNAPNIKLILNSVNI